VDMSVFAHEKLLHVIDSLPMKNGCLVMVI